jgi:2-oxoglutarate dehydrogenase E1 component
VWAQEESRNHGAWTALRESLEDAVSAGCRVRCASRPESAPSAGCRRPAHVREQQALLAAALRGLA